MCRSDLLLRSGTDSRARTVELVVHLVAREFRLRYQRSLLGYLWSVAQPLSRLVVLTFLFTQVLPLDIPNYPLFLFTGLIGWVWFSSGVSSATTSTLQRKDLLMRPGVSPTAVPVISVLTDGLDYLAAMPVLVLFLAVSGVVHPTALLLPVVLLPMVALILGLGFALSALNVYVRDIHHVVSLTMSLGFYLTPVFFSARQVPESLSWVVDINPMAWAIASQRAVVIEGTLPDVASFLRLCVVAVLVLAVGLAVYRRTSRTFVDEL